jgi:hypothetical protein
VSCRPRDQQPNTSSLLSPPLGEQALSSRHYGPPNPPAPAGSNSTGECNRPTSSDWSRSLQSSDVTFIDEINKFFHFIDNYSMCSGSARPGTKGEFFKWYLMLFLWPLRQNDVYWPQLLADILFAATPQVLVVFQHHFGLGGHGAIAAMVSYNKIEVRV